MAVIAAAGKMGVSSDELCAQAVGGLMAERYWTWANAHYAQGAADEIDNALSRLVGRQAIGLTVPAMEIPSDAVIAAAIQTNG
ncbi:hypothetical protein [Pseudomonas sp. RGM2987]|uniref:hypothetical protein n=1 Tax=Pseudomonas sp. RGM2987 TaxID=2930090 RepID=UPI001FD67B75|nr:hypothetical protein [Pseudomonas sp. RGM2987]MCJ8205810.1 hypothetical protein [Pseudomonas sp. RGM2987]